MSGRLVVLEVGGAVPEAATGDAPTGIELLSAAPDPSSETFFLREARLGLVLWERVPFRHRVMRAAGVLELFLVEAGLALERMRLEDLAEVTGAPIDLLERAVGRLALTGALMLLADGRYEVERTRAERVLAERRVPEIVLRPSHIAYCPDSDMTFVVTETGRRVLRRLAPPAQAPVGRFDEPVSAFLGSRASSRAIHGLDPDFESIDVWPNEPAWGTTCPCFFLRGRIPRQPVSTTVELEIFGETPKGAWLSLALAVPACFEMLEPWHRLDRALGEASVREHVSQVLFGTPLALRQAKLLENGVWQVPVDGNGARNIARHGWLGARWAVVLSKDTAKVDSLVEFEPADDEALVMFVLDHVGAALASQGRSPSFEEVRHQWADACAAYGRDLAMNMPALLVRLWDRRAFRTVHALREPEDFGDG